MRQAFAPLDDVLIERVFQPASDAMANHLGLQRSRTAAFCIELAILAWAISQAPDLSAAVLAWQATAALMHLLLLLLGLIALLSLRRLFQYTGSAAANPLRHTMQPHRGVLLLLLAARLMALHGLADTADLAMLGLAETALYLGACTTRPPARRVVGLAQAA